MTWGRSVSRWHHAPAPAPAPGPGTVQRRTLVWKSNAPLTLGANPELWGQQPHATQGPCFRHAICASLNVDFFIRSTCNPKGVPERAHTFLP